MFQGLDRSPSRG